MAIGNLTVTDGNRGYYVPYVNRYLLALQEMLSCCVGFSEQTVFGGQGRVV